MHPVTDFSRQTSIRCHNSLTSNAAVNTRVVLPTLMKMCDIGKKPVMSLSEQLNHTLVYSPLDVFCLLVLIGDVCDFADSGAGWHAG